MIITEVCCYFLISSTKKQRYIFCKNQTDKAHFRLRMVVSLLTIKLAVNLPNAGKASYGETDLRCRWRTSKLGNVQQKYISKFVQLQNIYLKQRSIESPTRNAQIEIGLGTWPKRWKARPLNLAGKSLVEDTIFASPSGDGTAILLGHPSHVKV